MGRRKTGSASAKRSNRDSIRLFNYPGELLEVDRSEQTAIALISYGPDHFREEHHLEKLPDLQQLLNSGVHWIDISGAVPTELLHQLEKIFGIHPLILEDIQGSAGRSHIEEGERYLFAVTRMIHSGGLQSGYLDEKLSFLLVENLLISFQERAGDVFDSIRMRIRSNRGRIRKMSADYLFYAILDAIVDNYFPFIETMEDRILACETDIQNDRDLTSYLHGLRRENNEVKRQIWAFRELVTALMKTEQQFNDEKLQPFLRNLFDHLNQLYEACESQQDSISYLMDFQISQLSFKMNSVMKVLTIIASIFIPLTFIAGVYGMNFTHIPGLQAPRGFAVVMIVNALIALGMILFFKIRKWF